MQCWQTGFGNSLRTPRQPDTLPNTTLTLTHYAVAHRTLPLWAERRLALAPETAGKYSARVCFSLLRKRHTNAGQGAAAKQHSTRTGAICLLRTHRMASSALRFLTAHDSIHQMNAPADSLCFSVLCSLISGCYVQKML